MGDHVVLVRGGEAARLALAERLRLLVRLCARGYLEQHRIGIVEEEVCEVLELVGVAVALELANDRTQRLGFGQHLNLGVKRTRTFHRARFAALAERLAVAEGLAVPKRLAVAAAFPLTERLAVARTPAICVGMLRANIADGNPCIFPSPVGGKVERPERAKVKLS